MIINSHFFQGRHDHSFSSLPCSAQISSKQRLTTFPQILTSIPSQKPLAILSNHPFRHIPHFKLSPSGLMNIIIIIISIHMSSPSPPETQRRRTREGRWTAAQADLFEELIEKYGKNWKKIQSFIRGRTLSQIRSHAQKFFRKVGEGRVREFERKAKLLEALDTLEKEKLRQANEPHVERDSVNIEERKAKLEQAEDREAGDGWDSSSLPAGEAEPRTYALRAIKEQNSRARKPSSQAPVVQTPTPEARLGSPLGDFVPPPCAAMQPGYSYYFLPAHPQGYYPGFNYPFQQ